MKLKKYIIPIELYFTQLEIWIGGTEKEMVDYVNESEGKKDGEWVLDYRSGAYFVIKDPVHKGRIKQRIVWVEKKDPTVLLHELFHAVCEIMAYKNIHLTKYSDETYVKDSEEAYAYLIEFLYKKSMSLIK